MPAGMSSQRRLSRAQLLAAAFLLALCAVALPGGLLPHAARARIREHPHVEIDLRIDGAGLLLRPVCGRELPARGEVDAEFFHVSCGAAARIKTQAHGLDARFGSRGVPLAAASRDATALFCGDPARGKAARMCLPVAARALEELAPEVYVQYVKTPWQAATTSGIALCCPTSEADKPLAQVDFARCGVLCNSTTVAT